MPPAKSAPAFFLSLLVAALMIFASAVGLRSENLYRDNSFVTSLWRGNDLVTLAVGAPLLLGAAFLARRGSARAQLVWLGMLAYALYNYAFYLFAAAFNRLFLVYAAVFALSIYALVFALTKTDAERLASRFGRRTPVRLIGAYLLAVAAGLGVLWTASSLAFVFTGEVPPDVVKTGHPTGIVYALDLSLLVPALGLGGMLLWRGRPWGYVLAAMSLVKGAAYTLVLTVTSLSAISAGAQEARGELPVWLSLTVANLAAVGFLLGNIEPARKEKVLCETPQKRSSAA